MTEDPTPWRDTHTGTRYASLDDAPPGSFVYTPRTQYDYLQHTDHNATAEAQTP